MEDSEKKEPEKLEQTVESNEIPLAAREAVVMVMDGAVAYGKLDEKVQGDLKKFARAGMGRLFDRYLVECMPGVDLADEKIWANVAPYLEAVPERYKAVLAEFHAARNHLKGLAQKSVSLIQMLPTATRKAIQKRQDVPGEVA